MLSEIQQLSLSKDTLEKGHQSIEKRSGENMTLDQIGSQRNSPEKMRIESSPSNDSPKMKYLDMKLQLSNLRMMELKDQKNLH